MLYLKTVHLIALIIRSSMMSLFYQTYPLSMAKAVKSPWRITGPSSRKTPRHNKATSQTHQAVLRIEWTEPQKEHMKEIRIQVTINWCKVYRLESIAIICNVRVFALWMLAVNPLHFTATIVQSWFCKSQSCPEASASRSWHQLSGSSQYLWRPLWMV